MDLGVSDAAQRLGVSRQRVLALISRGHLPAHRVGGRWVLDADDVALREQDRVSGRPMAPRIAWGLITVAEGHNPGWLKAAEVSRLRARLRKGPPLDQVAAWTRRRSNTLRLRGHPSALPRLLAVPEALPAGASAWGHDIVETGRVEAYLPASRAAQAIRDLSLREADAHSANALIKVPQGVWPFDEQPGPVAVAIDLWEAGDERSRRSARILYRDALDVNPPHTLAS